jgi:hypothetical protein
MTLNKWRQKCAVCGEWFVNSRNDRVRCYNCLPLANGETKPSQIKKTNSFIRDVKSLLVEIGKRKKINSVKALIEEFQDAYAEKLYNE